LQLCGNIDNFVFQLYYQHPEKKLITVVPMHKKDLPKGTLLAILKQAGIDKNEL